MHAGGGGSGTRRCAGPSWWPQDPVAVWLRVGARPCWLHGACQWLVSRHRHQGHGRGMVAWRRVLHHERGGISCAAWGRAAGSGGGQGRRQHRAPAGPGTRWGASCCRAVVHGTGVLRARHPGALRRVRRHGPRPTGRGGLLRPGWRQSVTGRPGPRRRSPATQQGFAGDGKQPPLVPRCGSFPRLKPSVRLPWKEVGRYGADWRR